MATYQALQNDQALLVGDSLVSRNGVYRLTLGADGNLTLTYAQGTRWATTRGPAPSGTTSFFAIMQSDGNFCIYAGTPDRRTSGALWHASANFPTGCRCFTAVDDAGIVKVFRGTCAVDASGQLVQFDIIDLLWSNETAGRGLIDTWAPTFHLHPNERCRPDSVDHFLASAALHDASGNVVTKPVTAAALGQARRDPTSYIALEAYPTAANYTATGAEVTREPDGTFSVTAPVYVRSRADQEHIDITYAAFFPVQGFELIRIGIMSVLETKKRTFEWSPLGRHGGDWEHVTVRLDPTGQRLQGIFCSRHGTSTWVPQAALDGPDTAPPQVWVALNSHAMYTSSGTVELESALTTGQAWLLGLLMLVPTLPDAGNIAWGKVVDVTDSDGLVTYLPADPACHDIVWQPARDAAKQVVVLDPTWSPPAWLDYQGRWGPPQLDNTHLDTPPRLPGDAQQQLMRFVSSKRVQEKLEDHLHGPAPQGPQCQGWWTADEP